MTSDEEKPTKKLSLKAQIEQIKLKHDDLSKRSADPNFARQSLPEVLEFIDQMRAMGRSVPPGDNRDLLISLASFWATYYFQHSQENIYPATTLEPYLGALEVGTSASIRDLLNQTLASSSDSGGGFAGTLTSTWQKYQRMQTIWQVAVIVLPLLVILGATLIAKISAGPNTTPTPTKPTVSTPDLSGTQVALEVTSIWMTQEAGQPLATQTSLPPVTATPQIQTPSSVDTPIVPTETLIPTPIPGTGIENLGVGVQVNNLNDLQEVPPEMELNVSYTNFSPGWSVHLLLQPLSKGLNYYPVPDFYLVDKGTGSGNWTVVVNFGAGEDLNNREQYAITPVMAISEAARKALAAAAGTGLEQLPDGVFTSPQLVTRVYTVVRRAYTVINEVRVVYSALDEMGTNFDLWAIKLDGSDPIRLTDTPNVNEKYSNLSPDGRRIAFVGGQYKDKIGGPQDYSLWIVNSDGSNPVKIAQDPDLVYDRPMWSPDGKTLAYNTSPADASTKGALARWSIYLYDLAADRTIRLDTGLSYARHPAWTLDGKTLYFSAYNLETDTLGIYQINLEGQEVRRVYDEKGNEIQPVVSPDGKRLLFLDYDTRELYALDLAKGRVQLIKTPSVLDLGHAVWGPDGLSVYFDAKVEAVYSIWSANLSDEKFIQMTKGYTEISPTVGLLVVYLPK